jgi:hypothetical protein
MSKNDKAFSKLVSGALSGDKKKMQQAMDEVQITDADIMKSAHEWALKNGFEYDEDSGWYTSNHMPPVDGDHIKGIYSLVIEERSNARLSQLQLMYMAGAIDKAALDVYGNPLRLVRYRKVVKT